MSNGGSLMAKENKNQLFRFLGSDLSQRKPNIYDAIVNLKRKVHIHLDDLKEKLAWKLLRLSCRLAQPWSVQLNASYLLHTMLTRMKANLCSHPCNITFEEWEKLLDDFIRYFKYVYEGGDTAIIYKDPYRYEIDHVVTDKLHKEMRDIASKIGEYFEHFWD